MHPAPPVLTPERIDAMLSSMAEICMAAVEEAGVRLKSAADDEAFERGNRTLKDGCRNLRQTIAMKQRFDREQARVAVERRREAGIAAEADRKEARRGRAAAVGRVRRHFERVLWDEYEDAEAHEIFEDVDERLYALADEDAFLDTPVETLIAQLSRELGVTGDRKAPEPGPRAKASGPPAALPSPAKAQPAPAPKPPPADRPPPPIEAAPEPPDPPPEPYLPPWERAPPGRVFPGGSGW